MSRRNIGSGAPWEARFGYSRAVRIGDRIWVAGTTAVAEDGSPVAVGDPYGQTRHALAIIERALRQAGSSLEQVVRTRLYVTDIASFEDVARAHAEVFGTIRPASTLVEVRRLVLPELLVEIEADAVID